MELWTDRSKLGCQLGMRSLRKCYSNRVADHPYKHPELGKKEDMGKRRGWVGEWKRGAGRWGETGEEWVVRAGGKWGSAQGVQGRQSTWPRESFVPGFRGAGHFVLSSMLGYNKWTRDWSLLLRQCPSGFSVRSSWYLTSPSELAGLDLQRCSSQHEADAGFLRTWISHFCSPWTPQCIIWGTCNSGISQGFKGNLYAGVAALPVEIPPFQ